MKNCGGWRRTGWRRGRTIPLANDIPLDKDNDLVQLADKLTIAGGVVTYVMGTVFSSTNNPAKKALVELWPADPEGDYSYSAAAGRNAACDANFAGFGQGSDGHGGHTAGDLLQRHHRHRHES